MITKCASESIISLKWTVWNTEMLLAVKDSNQISRSIICVEEYYSDINIPILSNIVGAVALKQILFSQSGVTGF